MITLGSSLVFSITLYNFIICIQMLSCFLTLSSVYTYFNTLKKKASGKHCGKK